MFALNDTPAACVCRPKAAKQMTTAYYTFTPSDQNRFSDCSKKYENCNIYK